MREADRAVLLTIHRGQSLPGKRLLADTADVATRDRPAAEPWSGGTLVAGLTLSLVWRGPWRGAAPAMRFSGPARRRRRTGSKTRLAGSDDRPPDILASGSRKMTITLSRTRVRRVPRRLLCFISVLPPRSPIRVAAEQ